MDTAGRDELVGVAYANDRVEAEMIQGLLESAGIPQRSAAQAGDAEELLRKVRAHKPDVAVVDVRMPPTQTDEGLRVAREIRAELPQVSVLVLSQYVEVAYARELLAESAEGLGYLLKDRVGDAPAARITAGCSRCCTSSTSRPERVGGRVDSSGPRSSQWVEAGISGAPSFRRDDTERTQNESDGDR
jgi:DNA-binding NarL/FixJ family response regulator